MSQKLNYLIYLLVRTLLTLVAAIFFGILSLILVLLLGGMGVPFFLAGLWAEWSWNLYTIAQAAGLKRAPIAVVPAGLTC